MTKPRVNRVSIYLTMYASIFILVLYEAQRMLQGMRLLYAARM